MKDLTEKDNEQLVRLFDDITMELGRKYVNTLSHKTIELSEIKQRYNCGYNKDVYMSLVRYFKAQYDFRSVYEVAKITQKANKRQAILSNNVWVLIGFGVMLALGGIALLVSARVSGMLLKPLISTGLHGNIISTIQVATFMILVILISCALILFFFKVIDYYESNSKEWNDFNKRRMQHAKLHADKFMCDILNDKNEGNEWWTDEK